MQDLTSSTLFRLGFFVELGMVLVAAAVGLVLLDTAFPFPLELSGRDCLWGLLATVPPVLGAVFLTSPLGRRIRSLDDIYVKVRLVLGKPIQGLTFLEVLLLAAAAGIGEEVLFRGVLQNDALLGLYLSSLLFGVLHALTPAYFLLAGIMGLYLGWLLIVTGNLLVPIIVHWLYDAAALWLLRVRFARDYAELEAESSSREEGEDDDEDQSS